MVSTKIRLGKYKNKTFDIPNFEQTPFLHSQASIIYLGACEVKRKQYRTFIGWGKVVRIQKGDKIDLVTLKFGFRVLKVIASLNHARRMAQALKRGHICSVFGLARIQYNEWIDHKTKEPRKGYVHRLYAMGFQDWYVPKMADLRAVGKGDMVDIDENVEEFYKDFTLEDLDMKGE